LEWLIKEPQEASAPRRIFRGDGEEMTGSKHNREGNTGEQREPDPGPYWRRMHLDWRFWVGALFMAAAIAIYVLSGDLAWIPHSQPRPPAPATAAQ
jgi:hypothetical protein